MQAAKRVAAATAVIYRRVSSESQSGERHVSLEVQAARTAAHIRAKGYVLAQTFTDVASGRRDDRQQYQAMLDFVRAGGASVIVTQFSTASAGTQGKSCAASGSSKKPESRSNAPTRTCPRSLSCSSEQEWPGPNPRGSASGSGIP